MIEIKILKKQLNCRISEDIHLMLSVASNKLDLSQREIIELSLLDFFSKVNGDFKYNGIDFKENAQIRKMRFLRKIQSLERTEILSKASFILRVEEDIFLMLISQASINELQKLFNARKREAKTYTEHKQLIEQIDNYYKRIENNYKEVLLELRQKFSDIKFIEQQENKTKKLLKLKTKRKNEQKIQASKD